ncbi:MAG: acyl-CoA thioesterase [Bacteroidaceae bacterium]|nr:acyl-CoA thioesterase [Bacteroidaceae bacterium]
MNKELPTASFRHKTDIQIRFNDIDRFGHVNNNSYFEYYDIGKEGYLTEVLKVDMRTQNIIPVVANINADFFLPVFFDDPIQVETAIVHLGKKSFTLLQRAVNKQTGGIIGQCSTVMVCFNSETQMPEEMPQEFRKAISEYEKDNLEHS